MQSEQTIGAGREETQHDWESGKTAAQGEWYSRGKGGEPGKWKSGRGHGKVAVTWGGGQARGQIRPEVKTCGEGGGQGT